MYLDDLLVKQKNGLSSGIFSVCSAHPWVIKQALITSSRTGIPPLIEATCNQVNQFGGYTGMKPADFVNYVRGIAEKIHFPFEMILLGGDHLGPSVWQSEPDKVAMEKAQDLVREYVKAGFQKIHLDCSMRLADDPHGALDINVSAKRAAFLASAAETAGGKELRYVIGTEVPIPGGATEHEDGVRVSDVPDVQKTIEITRGAFFAAGLQSAWQRVIAVVVQPGVEFGDDFVLPYQPEKTRELSHFIEGYPLVYEAHSTDYQTRASLTQLVQNHFAILKVGPALTFAFREAVFSLARVEDELISADRRSNIIQVLDEVMLDQPMYWQKYYLGNESEIAFKRKYSLSDRVRYYWTHPVVSQAFEKLIVNLHDQDLPLTLVSQFAPDVIPSNDGTGRLTPGQVIAARIQHVLDDYVAACSLQ